MRESLRLFFGDWERGRGVGVWDVCRERGRWERGLEIRGFRMYKGCFMVFGKVLIWEKWVYGWFARFMFFYGNA